MKTTFVFAFLSALGLSAQAQATHYRVAEQKINAYVTEDGYVMVEVHDPKAFYPSKHGHPSCGGRAYINYYDSLIVNLALSAASSGRKVHFHYDDKAPSVKISGHTEALGCRIFSMWILN